MSRYGPGRASGFGVGFDDTRAMAAKAEADQQIRPPERGHVSGAAHPTVPPVPVINVRLAQGHGEHIPLDRRT